MLGLLTYRRYCYKPFLQPLFEYRIGHNSAEEAYDDDNWNFVKIPYIPWGQLRFEYHSNEDEESYDDDNFGIHFGYHGRFGKFDFRYHNEEEETSDNDNWQFGITADTPWGKFRIGYHSNEDSDVVVPKSDKVKQQKKKCDSKRGA